MIVRSSMSSMPKHVKVLSRCWEGSFESESSSEVQLCVASSVVNAGLLGDDSKVKQGVSLQSFENCWWDSVTSRNC